MYIQLLSENDTAGGFSTDQIARYAFCSSDYLLKKTDNPLSNYSTEDLLEYLQS